MEQKVDVVDDTKDVIVSLEKALQWWSKLSGSFAFDRTPLCFFGDKEKEAKAKPQVENTHNITSML